MNNEFSGFEKSAPTSIPTTREQGGPTSSWDVDLSPFERLLEHHSQATQELTETFVNKIESLIKKQHEERTKEQKFQEQIQLEIVQMQETITENLANGQETLGRLEKSVSNLSESLRESTSQGQKIMEQMEKRSLDMNNAFAKMIHYSERMACSVEQLENNYQHSNNNKDNVVFWIFIAVILLFFLLHFIIPKYM